MKRGMLCFRIPTPALNVPPKNTGVHVQMKVGCFWRLGFLKWKKKAQGQRQCHAGPLVPVTKMGRIPQSMM